MKDKCCKKIQWEFLGGFTGRCIKIPTQKMGLYREGAIPTVSMKFKGCKKDCVDITHFDICVWPF